MKYVALPFDASQYLTKLPELAGQLPPGAREFATDPHHYDFGSAYSVKDLKLAGIDYADQGESVDLVLRFAHSPFSHAAPLRSGIRTCGRFRWRSARSSRRSSGWALLRWTRSSRTSTGAVTRSGLSTDSRR